MDCNAIMSTLWLRKSTRIEPQSRSRGFKRYRILSTAIASKILRNGHFCWAVEFLFDGCLRAHQHNSEPTDSQHLSYPDDILLIEVSDSTVEYENCQIISLRRQNSGLSI